MTLKRNDASYKKIPSLVRGVKPARFLKILLLFLFFFTLLSSSFQLNEITAAGTEVHSSYSFSEAEGSENSGLSAESNDFIDVTAESAIIVECNTGRILWQKNSTEKLFPASITKMVSGILAIEKISDLNQTVKISKNAAGSNNSFFPFKQGDTITIMDLLKSALICSHNNATIALAEHISGSEKDFVKLMNAKAVEIGAFNTNFQNSNGLDSNYPEHKSTAEDLAIIAKYCFENELFRSIVGTKKDTITLSGEELVIYNTNILLFFDYIKGIKTGFTDNSGYCLVLYSERENLSLITVILKSAEGYRESDALKLINWANDNFLNKKIIESATKYKKIEIRNTLDNKNNKMETVVFTYSYPEKDFEKLINKSSEITVKDNFTETSAGSNVSFSSLPADLPLSENQELGKMEVLINGRQEASMNFISKENIDKPLVIVELSNKTDSKVRNTLIFLIAFYFLIFILIIVRNLIQMGSAD